MNGLMCKYKYNFLVCPVFEEAEGLTMRQACLVFTKCIYLQADVYSDLSNIYSNLLDTTTTIVASISAIVGVVIIIIGALMIVKKCLARCGTNSFETVEGERQQTEMADARPQEGTHHLFFGIYAAS